MKKGTGKKVVRATAPPASTSGEGEEVVSTSVRMDKALHDRLRKLAFDKRTPMTAYIERGIQMVLKAEKY